MQRTKRKLHVLTTQTVTWWRKFLHRGCESLTKLSHPHCWGQRQTCETPTRRSDVHGRNPGFACVEEAQGYQVGQFQSGGCLLTCSCRTLTSGRLKKKTITHINVIYGALLAARGEKVKLGNVLKYYWCRAQWRMDLLTVTLNPQGSETSETFTLEVQL